MERSDLLKILLGDIKHISKINEQDIAMFNIIVIVNPKYVKKALIKYLNGNLTSKDLKKWAEFLCTRAEYVSPRHEDFNYFESMWYVIQKVSTPEIDGE